MVYAVNEPLYFKHFKKKHLVEITVIPIHFKHTFMSYFKNFIKIKIFLVDLITEKYDKWGKEMYEMILFS